MVALVAVLAIAIALWRLTSASSGLEVSRTRVGLIPATVFHPATAGPGPVVIIAHGFASSQQMMQPFALTLARNGYCAVSFDFPGHGRNPASMPGGLVDHARRNDALIGTLAEVIRFARALPCSDGRMALLGHSMGSEVVVRYAIAHPEVAATVGVSLFSRDASATQPRNLLVIAGMLEPQMLKAEGFRVASLAAHAPAEEHVTYGSFADGTARRYALAAGAEHIGVLYSRESQVEALAWMNRSFRRHGDGFVDARGPWLGLLFVGLVALGWPLSLLLPQVRTRPARPPMRRRVFFSIALLPAVITPLVLRKAPTDFLPIVLGDQMILEQVHFVDIEEATVRASEQAGLERLHTLGQRALEIEGADHAILGGTERQIHHRHRHLDGLRLACTATRFAQPGRFVRCTAVGAARHRAHGRQQRCQRPHRRGLAGDRRTPGRRPRSDPPLRSAKRASSRPDRRWPKRETAGGGSWGVLVERAPAVQAGARISRLSMSRVCPRRAAPSTTSSRSSGSGCISVRRLRTTT